jgi:hypothetical protein
MSGAIKMDKFEKFELNHAVTLFSQETTIINSLWTVYVAATFAAAGYGFTSSPLQPKIALAVALGFLAFAVGNWKLLKQGLTINQHLQKDISEFLACKADEPHPFRPSIKKLIATANPTGISRAIHIFIDFCVVIALLSRVNWSAPLLSEGLDKQLADAARLIIR